MNRSTHALRRARERYGIKLTTKDLDEIASKVRRGKASRLGRASGKCDAYAVRHAGSVLVAMYSRKDNRVLTFLPHAKFADAIDRLGLRPKVEVRSKCKKCTADVVYSVTGDSISTSTCGKGTEKFARTGTRFGRCQLCGGSLMVIGVDAGSLIVNATK